jgi:hypothetical protein
VADIKSTRKIIYIFLYLLKNKNIGIMHSGFCLKNIQSIQVQWLILVIQDTMEAELGKNVVGGQCGQK